MVNESIRCSSSFGISWKTSQTRNGVIGILAFEVADLMAKILKLWQSLSDDTEILKLREEILNSVAIRNLVFLDEDYLITLVLEEIVGDLVHVAKSVARLGKQCSNPVYHRLEQFFLDPVNNSIEWRGWEYRWKKMERKVKKMEKFMSLMLQFTQEEEVLSELEQTLRRMKANSSSDKVKLYEFRKKVTRHRQELRNIRDLSPWSRSYDYIVRLLARSIFTILHRITFMLEGKRFGLVCGSHHSLSYVPPSEPHLAKKACLNHIAGTANLAETKDVGLMSESNGIYALLAVSYSKHGRIDALPSTVGNAALTLHYANVVIQVEKLAASPSQLLDFEARDHLYNMLPTAIRAALRGKLRQPSAAAVVSPQASVTKMLDWLAPIAHNTVKWYSNRSIEEQHVVCGKNVLLVQTLYFADQGKVEAAITELLVALNYHFRVQSRALRCRCSCKDKVKVCKLIQT